MSYYVVTAFLNSRLDEDQAGIVASAFDVYEIAGMSLSRQGDQQKGPWQIDWYFDHKPDLAFIETTLNEPCQAVGVDRPSALIAPVPDKDWLAESYQQFPPFEVGNFFIYGSHYQGDVPDGLTGLQIDAATAFGSGEHGTTKGCLEALQALDFKPECVLDMGTGSGILGIAAWKLWQVPVIGIDIDPESIRVADLHCELNHVPSHNKGMQNESGDGYQSPLCKNHAPYDLIIANILAGPLIAMAGDLVSALSDRGYVILSGLLDDQTDDVLNAHIDQGLKEIRRIQHGEWMTLVLNKA